MPRHQVVLLIAKNGLLRRVTAAGLETYGYEVVVADDGEQAADFLRVRRNFTVLVTDADLGGSVDGLAIARLARDLNPKVEVIYTSRAPHRIDLIALVANAPMLRDPYHSHQLVGILGNLRQRPSEPETASVA